MNESFDDLGLHDDLLARLNEVGYKTPTPIQAKAIPPLLAGRDLLGVAQTGTGKTATFVLPILQKLATSGDERRPKQPRVLILAPTRELSAQINDELATLSEGMNIRQTVVIGGVGENPQIRALKKGVDVLVATPGRLLDLVARKHIDLSGVSVLVLDEADRLLDMGFVRDVRRIVSQTPSHRQSLLFSATMPKEVAALAKEILNKPERVDVAKNEITVKKIEQHVVEVPTQDKQRMLELLLRDKAVSRVIVFTRTKHMANRVAQKLDRVGISADAIHGNKSQNARQRALDGFKAGKVWVLVATDIAARGIDIDGVSHVVNYELPHEPESYVHRIGRTGRAGATGVAYSLVDPAERKRLRGIEKLIRQTIPLLKPDLPPREPGDEPEVLDSNRRRGNGGGNSNNRSEAGGRPRRRRRRSRAAA
ncbi:MAG: DEAD/DEAH box helicase [Pseudomonadales bacterium]|nr:DEAD/DEAH box helicase [Pseudomonadales bacterium]